MLLNVVFRASTTLSNVVPLTASALPLVVEIVPPLRANLALFTLATPPSPVPLAFNTKLTIPAPLALMSALIWMLRCAFSVSVTALGLVPDTVMALLRVMSPNSAPPALVLMVTLIPALSAASMVATVTMALSAVVETKVSIDPPTNTPVSRPVS